LMLLHYTKQSLKPIHLILAGLAAGLAVVTKPSAFLFLWPFAIYLVVVLRSRLGMAKMLLWAALAFGLLGIINGGHFFRNPFQFETEFLSVNKKERG